MSVIVLAKKTTLFLVAAVVFYILLFVTNTRNQFRDIKENSWTHNANQIAYNKFRQVVPTNSHLYVEKLEKLRGGVLTKCRDVHSPTVKHLNTPSIRPPLAWINIGMVLVNLNPQPSTLLQDLRSKFSLQTTRNLNIMLDYVTESPLHFIVVTNKQSAEWAGQLIASIVSKRLTLGVIQGLGYRWRKTRELPPVLFSLVESQEITDTNTGFIQGMRDNIHPDMSSKDKYKNDFYYIAPLYHLAFTGLDKVVFIDISDMEFTVDIKELYDEFTKLESSPAILGIGLDLSPHYFGYLKSYIESHPGTDIGKPGKNQGLNTGVVLYRLDKMRVNELYNSFLNKQKIDYLVKKFGYPFALAEQDFFTNLGFMFPDLFHILPCQFNTQTSLQYLSSPFENIFKSYHYCDRKENIKIFHLNGCGPTPAQCGGNNKSSTVYDKDHDLHFYHIEVQVFWEIMEGLYRDEMKETQET